MKRSMGVALLGLVAVGCGDERAQGRPGDELVDVEQMPRDAGAQVADAGHDAGDDAARDAASGACASCDAGKVGDAAAADAWRRVDISAVPSSCRAGETSGRPLLTHCYSESELSRMGCILGTVGDASKGTVVATEAEMRKTHWALSYTTSPSHSLYLCTGAEPATDWIAGTPLLIDSASRTMYQLSLMRIAYAQCAD